MPRDRILRIEIDESGENMQTEQPERRKYKRVFFSEVDGITGTFTLSREHDRLIRADISDLCNEGLCLILNPDDQNSPLQQGDHLTLIKVQGEKDFSFLTDIEMEVKWTLNLKHLAIGCEFLNTSQERIDQIRKCINARAKLS